MIQAKEDKNFEVNVFMITGEYYKQYFSEKWLADVFAEAVKKAENIEGVVIVDLITQGPLYHRAKVVYNALI